MKPNRSPLAVLSVLVFSTLLQSHAFNKPWSGKDVGYNGAFYSILARNYVRYGFLQTKLGPVRNNGKAGVSEFAYYLNHPPLLPILIALSFKLFGINEQAARGVPLAFSFLYLWMLYLLAWELWGKELALTATAIAAFIPMSLFYGSHVEVFGPVLLFFVLLTVYAYWRWLQTNQNRAFFLLLSAFCVGAFVEWDIYLLALLLPAHAYVSKGQSHFTRKILLLPCLAFFCIALFFLHSYLLFGTVHLKEYAQVLTYRQRLETVTTTSAVMQSRQTLQVPSSLKAAGDYLNWVLFGYVAPGAMPRKPHVADYLLRSLLYLMIYFNPLVILAFCLWLYQTAFRASRQRSGQARNLLFSLLGLGLFRCLFFYNETWEHRYIYFLLIPPVSFAAALGAQAAFKEVKGGFAFGVTVLFLLISFETTWKLHALNDDFSGKSLGELIRRHTAFSETAMTSSGYSYQALYYADRRIFFDVRTWDRFRELGARSGDPACFLSDRTALLEPKLLGTLKANYTYSQSADYTVFSHPSDLGTSSQTR